MEVVAFQPGETGPKLVNISLVDDTIDEPTEKFSAALASSARVMLGPSSLIIIEDDDGNYCEYIFMNNEGGNEHGYFQYC